MRLTWTKRSRRDLRGIGAYIARDDPGAAITWIGRLKRRAEIAAAAPLGGRIVPELGRDDIREVFLRTYRLIYRITKTEIRMLTVIEGHQQLPADLDPDA